MKLYIKTVLILMIATSTLVAENLPNPQIRFDIMQQDTIQADGIELQFNLKKTAGSLDKATQSMAELIRKVRQTTERYAIPSKDIQIQSTFMSTSDWLFGKDYIVTSFAKITIHDLSKWQAEAKELTQLDPDMQFSGVTYTYPKSNTAWETLLAKATTEMQTRKAHYERLFKTKLRLSYLRESRYAPSEQPQHFLMRKMAVAADQAASSQDVSTVLPTQMIQVNWELGFELESK